MIGAAVWITCLWWMALGPNEAPLIEVIQTSDALEHRLLPTAEILSSLSPLWLVTHGRADWPPFFFIPADEWHERRAPGLLLGSERLLAPLQVPRLFVSQKYLREGSLASGFKPLEPLAVDQADAILKVLVEIHLKRTLADDPDLRRRHDERAERLMVEVPAKDRPAAYFSAELDFAAHLLSIAHEIGRHQRRKPGGELCKLLSHPASLFGFWRRVVETGSYPGMFRAPSASGEGATSAAFGSGSRPWRMTKAVLGLEDKYWVMKYFLGDRWSGDPEKDFAFLCGP